LIRADSGANQEASSLHHRKDSLVVNVFREDDIYTFSNSSQVH